MIKLRDSGIILGILSLVVLAALIFYGYYYFLRIKSPSDLRMGKVIGTAEVYAVSHGPLFSGPRFLEVDIDPRKVSLGDIQHLRAVMESPDEVVSVKAVTDLDFSAKTIELQRQPDGTWGAEWKVEDTSTKTYHTTFIAKGKDGKEGRFTMAWSDPCSGVPLNPGGGTAYLSGSCSVSGVDGVDNGHLNLNGYTLTINGGATFVWNSGYSITVNGTIAVAGQMRNTNLYDYDADSDGYSSGSVTYSDSSPGAGWRRRYTTTAIGGDCNDSNGGIWQNLTGYQDSDLDTYTTGGATSVCSGASLPSGWLSSANGSDCNDSNASLYQNLDGYTDSDGDGYGTGVVQSVCSGASLPAGYAGNRSDCYDANANARPGQSSFFTTDRGDGSFDYNCDSSQELEISTVTQCA